jgi:AcrR family transcriptional regulator
MAPRPDVSEERRHQIVESAAKVFARKGFADARMDDVAAEAGLSKGLLYWYFKSKDEILIAMADWLFGGKLRKMRDLPGEGLSAHACLLNCLDMFIADLRGLLKMAPVIYEFYALAFRNRTVRRVMRQYLLAVIGLASAVSFAYLLRRNICSRCINFSCPLNQVDVAERQAFFARNPAMAQVWEDNASPSPAAPPPSPT